MVERAVYPDRVGILVAGLDLAVDSITHRLEELGVVFTDAEHVIDAVPASAEDARMARPPRQACRCCASGGLPPDRSGPAGRVVRRPLPGPPRAAFSVRNSISVNALSRTAAQG